MIKYSVNEKIKQINLFDERFYQIDSKNVFNVTGWLEAFPKGFGFKEWLMNTKDPDAIRDEAAQRGSDVHKLIELTLLGNTVKWEEHQTNLEVWERFLGWCNFWKDLQTDPKETLKLKNGKKKIKNIEMKEDFTEFITYDLDYEYAGTVDKMIKIIFEDETFVFAILDWKTGKNIYDTAYIQVATYMQSVKKQYNLEELLGFIVQPGLALNKSGYRVYPIEDPEEEFGIFIATQKLYKRAFGEPKPRYKIYPIEVNLDFIKNNQIVKEN